MYPSAQVSLNLLEELKAELRLSYLFVAHDLSGVVRHISGIASRLCIWEESSRPATSTAFSIIRWWRGAAGGAGVARGGGAIAWAHPYTQALLSAAPLPDPHKERARRRIILKGDLPSPANPPSGCRFRTRCQKFADELNDQQRQICMDVDPVLCDQSSPASDHRAACHYVEGEI